MRKLFKYLKPYAMSIAVVLVLIFFQSLSDLYLPTLMSDIVNKGIFSGDTNYIIRVGGKMLLVAAVGTACAVLASYLSSKISSGFGKILRKEVFSKVESFSLNEFNNIGTASLITRTTNDITQIQQVLLIIFRMMVSAPMM
ncbi:MAG TPA: multidrug ABC transporter ATP-binding protein, partial [Clostridiaceae bacterium]|nr:multidrug ABC transporter ATP-binding protein [Clostridiaceae bacterium]